MNKSERSSWLTRLDYFFVIRPMLFFPGWTTMLAGYFIADKGELYTLSITHAEVDYLLLIRLIVGFGLLMGSSFILNQLADVETDRRNDKLYFISNSLIARPTAIKEAVILGVIGVVIVASCGLVVGILAVIFIAITGILYNNRPFRLKDRPWWSLLANMIMGFLAFALGWTANQNLSNQLFLDSIPYILFNTALYLYTLLPDIAGDQITGKKTLAVIYGHEKLMFAAFVSISFGFVSIFWLQDMTALVFYMLTMPLFIKGMYIMEIPAAVKTTKYGILFISLSVCLKWPVYFILMLVGFFGTKLYFRKRFHLDYPNFSGY
jgi:4-hydroxybenzoate polyprenyltransferase